jgi:hypothetical protein
MKQCFFLQRFKQGIFKFKLWSVYGSKKSITSAGKKT